MDNGFVCDFVGGASCLSCHLCTEVAALDTWFTYLDWWCVCDSLYDSILSPTLFVQKGLDSAQSQI